MTFTGFPREGIQFLRDIDDNNNRDWFEAHKHIYQTALVEPAQAFIVALGERLQTIAPNVQYDTRTNGSGSLMRIYRDVRFSKDKSPYKNWIGIVFWEGQGKKTDNSSSLSEKQVSPNLNEFGVNFEHDQKIQNRGLRKDP